ncbi:signal recognition particle receptor alpha subunit, putative [Perkinsus marinus ATCC 50983]|uniref:Signal recognition particle receptor alpha subunit, putative n=1 Tax=Perkinsus marinus (strain ATCC 50983 / TXsc) TaxID=423536 RepID=C5K8M7_PERM5|nr:signal recognition particle receptor alpha subunit, putative [Perkinsus marinus ATCC 50983]EER19234.1 signal recognition particle receptor alpha subunit, putative [Perkinsus marinus ATCC 50983]|eukprot:XP_002787438.1 signal recognition particle receptor alpha subunit, putative [Perkinsus marinus ATCC 50983]
MIDGISIFTKGGIVLWSTTYAGVQEDTLNKRVDKLVKEVLIEDRAGVDCIYEDKIERYCMKWKNINNIGLVLVIAYEGVLKQLYLNYLLDMLTKEFLSAIDSSIKSMEDLHPLQNKEAFKVRVDKILVKADREVKSAAQRKGKKKDNNKLGEEGVHDTQEEEGEGEKEEKASKEELIMEARRKLKMGMLRKGSRPFKGNKVSSEEEEENDDDKGEGKTHNKKGNKKKSGRVWDTSKVTTEAMNALDMSKRIEGGTSSEEEEGLEAARRTYLPSDDDDSVIVDDDDLEDKATTNGIFATLTRQLKNITGNQVLTNRDLEPVLATFCEQLMSKNVAMDVANAIADGVSSSLVGTRTGQFTSVHTTVKDALTQSISRILTPKKSVDVLRAAMQAKANGQVYSIVFLGVNGVGKSTNLSKVAYYLRKKGGLRVLICACDTFRAGAVEQLRTHARCLNVDLFEKGYGKDAAEIAKQGLYYAKHNAYDVVLIDTAGRMQDNEPLMKSLARLVAVNNPDLILFVGEALVGYDAIDQLTKFDRALMDYSLSNKDSSNGIDGILLTKYDTVDDKVGAALSMVYITGEPIVFVGTGQKRRPKQQQHPPKKAEVVGKKRKARLQRLIQEGKVSKSELSSDDLQNAKKIPGLQWSCEGVMDEAEMRSKFLKQGVHNKHIPYDGRYTPECSPCDIISSAYSMWDEVTFNKAYDTILSIFTNKKSISSIRRRPAPPILHNTTPSTPRTVETSSDGIGEEAIGYDYSFELNDYDDDEFCMIPISSSSSSPPQEEGVVVYGIQIPNRDHAVLVRKIILLSAIGALFVIINSINPITGYKEEYAISDKDMSISCDDINNITGPTTLDSPLLILIILPIISIIFNTASFYYGYKLWYMGP